MSHQITNVSKHQLTNVCILYRSPAVFYERLTTVVIALLHTTTAPPPPPQKKNSVLPLGLKPSLDDCIYAYGILKVHHVDDVNINTISFCLNR